MFLLWGVGVKMAVLVGALKIVLRVCIVDSPPCCGYRGFSPGVDRFQQT